MVRPGPPWLGRGFLVELGIGGPAPAFPRGAPPLRTGSQAGAGLKWLAARKPETYREKKQDNDVSPNNGIEALIAEMTEQSRQECAEHARLSKRASCYAKPKP